MFPSYTLRSRRGPSRKLSLLSLEARINPAPALLQTIQGINFDEDGTNNGGFRHVPPDPSGAASATHVVSVVNTSIEFHQVSGGVQQDTKSLMQFFNALSPANALFDPKVVFDQFENRFVVVALEMVDAATTTSRILVAVSDDADPNGTWRFLAINSEIVISGNETWADYPGIAVDEQAVYITANMFRFFSAGGAFRGVRLWIADKGVSGGWYGGGIPIVSGALDPYASAGFAGTTMPAHIYGTPPSGATGTLLIAYNGLSDGTNESVQIVRVNNPLTSPTFTHQFVGVGNFDNTAAGVPGATQSGTATTIDAGDRRVYNAVWRDNKLYFATTINPATGSDAGQATVHWFNLNTTNLASITVNDHGNVGGEDIATGGIHTFYPSVAVDVDGSLAIGFGASGPNIFPGAYYTGRKASAAAGTVESTGILKTGEAFYVRVFGGGANRWGDYSAMSLAPDGRTFWAFNEYAMTQGTPGVGTGNGRWSTMFGRFVFNSPPAITDDIDDFAVDEDASPTNIDLNPVFQDAEDPDSALTFSVVANSNTGLVTTTFPTTPNNLRLTYTANGAGSATITVRATDTTGAFVEDTFTVTVNPINDAPVLDTAGNMALGNVAEDATGNAGTLITDLLASAGDRITDVDAGAIEGIAVIAADTANGSWQYSINGGTDWLDLGAISGTSARLLASDANTRIRFLPNLNFNGTISTAITFHAWDRTSGSNGGLANPGAGGGTSAFSTATETASLTVTPVNDAPELDNTGDMALGTILEDAVANNGTLVTDVIASAGGDRITDVDSGAVEGIAVIAAETANGSWQFSINSGTDWNALGSVSTTNARLLASDANTRIRFVPNANFNGTIGSAITLRAWDRTAGTNGGTADPSTNGGITPYSIAIETAIIIVTPVNDAPVLDPAGNMALGAIAEDAFANSGTLITDLLASAGDRISDPDAGALEGIAVTAAETANGSWQYSLNNGTDWLDLGAVSGTSARLLASDGNTRIRFIPNLNFNGTINTAITFHAWDRTTGTHGGLGDPSTNGGTSAFSTATETASLTVTPVNDAPELDNTAAMALGTILEDAVGNAGTLITDLLASAGDRISDVDAGALEGIAVIAADAANGAWQYSINGGTDWNALGSVSGTNARLLASDANTRIRFVPNANFNGTLNTAITFHAWDRSTGANGDLANPGSGGGTSAYSTATETASLVVTPVNDVPSFTKGADQTVGEDSGAQTVTGWATNISAGPSDESSQVLTFLVSTNNDGLFSALPAVSANGTLTYTPATNASGSATVTVRLKDDGGTANGGVDTSAAQTFTINITAVNDAPVLDNAGNMALTTILEDATGNAGTLITDLLASAGDRITDVDSGAVEGIAVIAADTANGSWQYSINGGTDWNALGSVSTTNARLLASDANTRIRLVPNVNFNGTLNTAITFHAWDRTTGSNGGQANPGSGGGASAFSTATETASLVVTPVNDVPSFTKGGDQSVLEDAGAQTVTGWATNILSGPADESSQVLTFLVTTNNDALFSALPAVSASGTLTYTPAANANGSATVTVRLKDDGGTANGGVDTSAAQTFTIGVTAVNDVPSFTKGADQTVGEDSGAQTVTGWATNISKGPSDESGQTLTFLVSTNNDALFSAGPAVSANGTLTYTPAANANGSATVTVRLKDDGGTANGGVDTSAAQTFTIGVTAVNDVPTFTKGADQTVGEDSGAQTVTGWATNISAGPSDESGQVLTFLVTTNNDALFSALPAVSANGTLTYTPATNASGSATVTVRLKDDGGTANGGVDTSAAQTFTINVTAVNDAPVLDNAGNMALTTILEDATGNAGTLITDLLASAGDRITDVDAGAVEGIAVIAADTANGSWQYSINGGTDWNALGSVSTTNSRLLASDTSTRIRLVPNANFNGTLNTAITFHAWDRTSGSNGGLANPGSGGGATAFSTATETASLVVTPVNDVPSFTKGADQSVLEDAGAQTVTGWATNISSGPADESSQVLTFLVTTNNDGLFSALPAVSASGTLTYTPAANANGSATVTVRLKDDGGTANGGVDTSAAQTFTIGVTAVNDVPSFTKGADQSVLEDAGAQTVTGWATNISKGPADESGQTLTFLVSTNNDALFSAGPAVSANGTLTYTPAANANGSATVTVRLKDDGGTANGGVDTSAAQTFTIGVTAVNDVPTFTKGADQTVGEDSGAQTVTGWATNISAGPSDESGQVLTFLVTTNNDGLFSALPAVSANGTLTYTPATNASGSATVTVRLKDDGGTANGGVDTSAAQTFTININAVNDAPVLDNAGNMALGNIAEDAVGNNGTLIADLLASAGDRISDVDAGALEGTAIIAADTANGSWQYSLNNGTDWLDLGAVSGTSARLLASDANSRVRFVPNLNFNGTVGTALTFQAWDRTSGSNGALVNPGSGGGTTAFSTAIETASLVVTPVNDAPVLDNAGEMILDTILEDAIANAGTLVTDLIASAGGDRITDVDNGALEGIAVTAANTSIGSWEYSLNNGSSWLALGSVSATTARLLVADAGTRVRFVPNANVNGTLNTALTFRAWDRSTGANGGTADTNANGGITPYSTTTETANLSITAVNDVPSFIKGVDQSVLEDAGPQTASGWATNISSGPADESGQVLTFLATTNNDALFSVLPAISPAGILTYSPAANANGSATITVRLRDDGGTANGGVDTSAAQTFTINVTAVNDVPSFTKGADQTVNEDAGAQTAVGWATNISKGPADESGQTLTFLVSTDNDAMFSAAPAIGANGTLTYTPAINANGSATVTVRLRDSGGTANGGVDTTAAQTFTINVNPVNDAPVLDNTGTTTLGGILEDAVGNNGTLISGLIASAGGDRITDIDAGALEGVAVTAVDVANGSWQFSTNDGANWAALGSVSATNARLLAADAGTRVRFVPNANFNGVIATALTFRAWDRSVGTNGTTADASTGGGTTAFSSSLETAGLTVTAVNDAPSFNLGATHVVLEDGGAQNVFGFATSISPGPADESGQSVTFEVNSTNGILFSAVPSISPTGTLTYTPAANAFGTATVTVRLHDTGGLANGGADTSADQTFTIEVKPVNDVPSFIRGPDQSLAEDPGPQTIPGWATALSAGPGNEANQVLSFQVVSNSSPGMFVAGPAVASDGTLTFTPAQNANGSATISIRVRDDGGTADGGVDTSAAQTFTINIGAVNDAPNAQTDNVTALVGKPLAINVLANDSDADGDPFTLVSFTAPANGTVRRVGNSLIYNTRLLVAGTDSFTYTVADNKGASSVGQVQITVLDQIAPTIQAMRFYYGPSTYMNASSLARAILPWERLHHIAIVFSEGVNVNANALSLIGINGAYSMTFTYNAATRTATWTPTVAVGNDRLTIRLSGAGVTDSSGNAVKADWARTIGLLTGDYDGNGLVDNADVAAIKSRFTRPGVVLNRFADIDGNGIVNQIDLNKAIANKGRRLR